jgi:hypothetical protein
MLKTCVMLLLMLGVVSARAAVGSSGRYEPAVMTAC